jgi:hypothetical protein
MRFTARSTLIAGALAIAAIAIAVPAASARVALDPQQGVYVNPSKVSVTPVPVPIGQTTSPGPEVHPNPDQQTPQTSPVVPPILHRVQGSQLAAVNRAKAQALASRLPATARYSNADLNGYATAAHPVAAATPTLKAPSNGFDWGDAAIGGGIAAAAALLITAGALTVRHRAQPRHP